MSVIKSFRGRRTGSRARAAPVRVEEEQRRHLAQCCAFFKEERFREAGPDTLRAQDLADARSDINAALGVRRRRGKP